jgi:protein TonB
MKTRRSTPAACAALLVTLAACSHDPRITTSPEPYYQWPASDAPPVSALSSSFDSVDTYKYLAAKHIMRHNSDHTFSGKLPPMLPAVVVLRITVDDTGRLSNVWVQRSRDDDASRVAMDSVRRAGSMPRPFNLASGPGRSLTYSETFLFNHDYRFQIRTLAPIQTED